MAGVQATEFSEKDILFLVETVDHTLLNKIGAIKDDPEIIEEMMENEAYSLFRRIMLMAEESITTAISPRFLFEVLLRTARRDLESQGYTISIACPKIIKE